MAAVRVRKGKLYIDYYDGAGKRLRRALGLKNTRENRKEAETIKKQIEYEVASGVMNQRLKVSVKKSMTLSAGLKEFQNNKSDNKKSTQRTYRNAVEKFIQLAGDMKIKQITPDIVKGLENKIRREKKANGNFISENTVASYINRLHILFNFFIKEHYAEANPFPTKEINIKEIITIPDKELEDILEKLKVKNRKHYKVIAFLLLTGLRRGEIIGLSFENNIDFTQNILKVFNYKKNRVDKLPLYNELKDFIFQEWDNMEGLLFDYKSSESLKFFEKFLKKEGYHNYSFHTLRKTFISKLVNSGMNVYDVMNLARHKNIKTTLKHYSAADLNRMGNEISARTNFNSIVEGKKKSKLKLLKTA